MTPESVEFAIRPDIVLRGQVWAGGETTLLLAHEPGNTHDLDDWRALMPFLLGFGVTVVSIDLRGHGASDGEWAPEPAESDLAAIVNELRRRWAARLVVCAAGKSGLIALRVAGQTKIDGIVLLSPWSFAGDPPRGAGEPKLLIRAGDDETKTAFDRLRPAMIGPARFLTVPGAETGAALFAGESAVICREHLFAFLKEIRVASEGKAAPDRFLDLLGIRPKGTSA